MHVAHCRFLRLGDADDKYFNEFLIIKRGQIRRAALPDTKRRTRFSSVLNIKYTITAFTRFIVTTGTEGFIAGSCCTQRRPDEYEGHVAKVRVAHLPSYCFSLAEIRIGFFICCVWCLLS